jgi:GntR family transcriptional regulator
LAPLQVLVHPGDELPIYRQIEHQIIDAIAGGRLRPGDQLPSHRELAMQLVIAPLTVKKAYDELELAGLIETQRGRGTFVRDRLRLPGREEKRERLREPAKRLLSQAALSGVPLSEVIDLLREIRKGMKDEARL